MIIARERVVVCVVELRYKRIASLARLEWIHTSCDNTSIPDQAPCPVYFASSGPIASSAGRRARFFDSEAIPSRAAIVSGTGIPIATSECVVVRIFDL